MSQLGSLLAEVSSELGWEYREFRHGRLHELRKGNVKHYVMGYSFPFNSSATAKLVTDKVATSTVLSDAGMDAVQHLLIFEREGRRHQRERLTEAGLPSAPVILKPLMGSGGRDVYQAHTFRIARRRLRLLFERYDGLGVVSPYLEISREVRVILLDEIPLLVFEKIRHGDWRHNLAFGSEPRPLPFKDCVSYVATAQRACEILGIRLAAVDLVETDGQPLRVLEVNDGIQLDKAFAGSSKEHRHLALSVYRSIILALVEK